MPGQNSLAFVGLPVELEIVKRTDKNGGFKVLRRRWVIERTFSWLCQGRCVSKIALRRRFTTCSNDEGGDSQYGTEQHFRNRRTSHLTKAEEGLWSKWNLGTARTGQKSSIKRSAIALESASVHRPPGNRATPAADVTKFPVTIT